MQDTEPMSETLDTKAKAASPAPQEGKNAAQTPDAGLSSKVDHTKIRSHFVQSPSTYWALMLPLLGIRYLAESIHKMMEPWLKFVNKKKTQQEKSNGIPQFTKPWAMAVGGVMTAATGIYTVSTYGDMKRQFAEAVGWEFDKSPEKVNLLDITRSKNIVVHDAIRNFVKRTTLRFAADLPFFAFLAPALVREKNEKPFFALFKRKQGNPIEIGGTKYTQLLGPGGSVVAGVGANSAYLASDSLGRKLTFFEEEQRLIASKINHSDAIGDVITANDLLNLYDHQARLNPKLAPLPKMDSPQWQENTKVFTRMADLMNQTYNNTPNTEQADFIMPKFIYLVGMGLVTPENPEKSAAYVEIANRYGIPAVKKVAEKLEGGADFKTAIADYPAAPHAEASAQAEPRQPVGPHTAAVAGEIRMDTPASVLARSQQPESALARLQRQAANTNTGQATPSVA